MKSYLRYAVYALYAVTLLFLVGNSDFRKLVRNYIKLADLRKQDSNLDLEYEKLRSEKARLLNPKDNYLEQVARKELNLAKQDELEFRFTPPSGKK